MNLVEKFLSHVDRRADKTALHYFNNNSRYSLNWEQVYDRVEQIYRGLNKFKVRSNDNIAIWSNTCKEWGFLDLAIMAQGAVTVPIYHSSPIEDVEFILNESQPKILFVENQKLWNGIKKMKLNFDVQVVLINEFQSNENITFLKSFISNTSTEISIRQAAPQILPSQLATIIYTSGTSGQPKGVCLQHEQIMSAVSEVFPLLGVTENDTTLTFLPFTHVLGRIELWGHYFCGYTLGYAQSIERIKKNLPDIQPTVLVGVPRIFEKIYFGMKAQIEISKLKQSVFRTALKVGQQTVDLRQSKKTPSFLLALKSFVAHHLVFSNIHKKLGGKLRFAISGGAPLEPAIAKFFTFCGIHVLEGYGLTETTGPIFVNTLFENKTGTVGKAIGEVQITFDTDNEILIKSKKVMSSYYLQDKETKKVFTDNGFFRTGDIGTLDSEGFLKITDRKKDLIKTAGGKFIAPQKIQNLFATQPLVSHAHIHGDRKKFISAILTLDKDEVLKVSRKESASSTDYHSILNDSGVQQAVRKVVADVNSQLASFETIKRYHILDHDFTIAEGHLTPSLKMKRRKIDEMYSDEIEGLYR